MRFSTEELRSDPEARGLYGDVPQLDREFRQRQPGAGVTGMRRMLPVLRSIWIWFASAVLFLFWAALMAVVWLFDRDPRRIRTARCFRRLGRALAKVNPWSHPHLRPGAISPGPGLRDCQQSSIVRRYPGGLALNVDAKWLGKAELFRVPVMGWMLKMAGDIPVERGDRSKSARALLKCAQRLRQGCSIVFFPEGTRSLDGAVRPFNEGPFQLAIRERVPILPLVVDGTGDALPRDSWIFGGAREHPPAGFWSRFHRKAGPSNRAESCGTRCGRRSWTHWPSCAEKAGECRRGCRGTAALPYRVPSGPGSWASKRPPWALSAIGVYQPKPLARISKAMFF